MRGSVECCGIPKQCGARRVKFEEFRGNRYNFDGCLICYERDSGTWEAELSFVPVLHDDPFGFFCTPPLRIL